MKFLLLMQVNPAVLEALSPDEQKHIGDGHGAFIEAISTPLAVASIFDPFRAATL